MVEEAKTDESDKMSSYNDTMSRKRRKLAARIAGEISASRMTRDERKERARAMANERWRKRLVMQVVQLVRAMARGLSESGEEGKGPARMGRKRRVK